MSTVGCVGSLALGSGGPALAEVPPRVVVVAPSPSEGVTIRIARELRVLGVEVVVVVADAATEGSRSALERAAREAGAFAAIRIVNTGEAAEVWVADRVTGKTVIREVVERDPSAETGEVALGAVELLRASLLELRVAEEAAHGEVAATPAITRLAPSPPPPPATVHLPVGAASPPAAPTDAFAASLGGLASAGLRGAGPLGGAAVTLHGRLGTSPWGIESEMFALLGQVGDRRAEPTATTGVTLAWLGIAPTFSPGSGAVVPRFGAGLAAAHVELRGVADPPLVGTHEEAWFAAPFLRGGVGVALSPRFRARADAWFLVGVPEIEIRLDGRRAGSFGRPELLGAASLEVVVP